MTVPDRPRVVIGEDQALVREGLRLVLERHDFEIVGEAGDGEDLVRKALAHRPDVVVADIRMPPTQSDEGLRAALAIRAAAPDVALMVLSQHVQRRYAQELLAQAGEGGGAGEALLPLPVRVRPDDPLRQLRSRIEETLGQARLHAAAFLDEPEEAPPGVSVACGAFPVRSLGEDGTAEVVPGAVPIDLALRAEREGAARVRLVCRYRTGRFEAATIDRLLQRQQQRESARDLSGRAGG